MTLIQNLRSIITKTIQILSLNYSINLKAIKSLTRPEREMRRRKWTPRHKVTTNGGIQRLNKTGTSTKFSRSLKFKRSLRVKVLRVCHMENLTMNRIFNRQLLSTMILTKKSLKKLSVLRTKSESQLRICLWLNWPLSRWSLCCRTVTWTRLL